MIPNVGAELPVLAKIRKLLNLAKSANEHEAALAASRAAELMAEHGLAEAELRVTDATKTAEPIVEDVGTSATQADKRGVLWKGQLARGVTAAHGCKFWWHGPSIRLLGRKSAVQAADYTITWLVGEVERLADAAWNDEGSWGGGNARAWKNSFLLGCAMRIAERLIEQAKAHPELAIVHTHKAGRGAVALPALQSTALVVLAKDAIEVCREWDRVAEKFTARRGPTVSNRGAYAQGHEAGGNVNLGGGRALGAGAKRLGGGS